MESKRTGDAFLIVDVQNDFCPGGALPVPEGDAVVRDINGIAEKFSMVVACQDWHPAGHSSFASRYPGKNPFDVIQVEGKEQVLWPDHCIQGTHGAAFHPDLDQNLFRYVVRKGIHQHLDSYSAFLENDVKTPTGLIGLMKELEIKRVFVAGLATDYCVHFSALDACKAGFEVKVLIDVCRGVDIPPGTVEKALNDMRQRRGIEVIRSDDIR